MNFTRVNQGFAIFVSRVRHSSVAPVTFSEVVKMRKHRCQVCLILSKCNSTDLPLQLGIHGFSPTRSFRTVAVLGTGSKFLEPSR